MNDSSARSLFGNIAEWLRNWSNQFDHSGELEDCGKEEAARIAQDVGVSPFELCTLASKGHDVADLLSRRMKALHIDQDELARTKPGLLRDLQKLCGQCNSHRCCARDLAEGAANSAWQDYCPSASTLRRFRRKTIGYLGLSLHQE